MEILTALALGLAAALLPSLFPEAGRPLPPRLQLWLAQAGLERPRRFWMATTGVVVACLVLLASLPWPVPLTAPALLALPCLAIEGRRRARLEGAEYEVAGVVAAVALGVGAGRDLDGALGFAVARGKGPLAVEFRAAMASHRLGQPREEAFGRARTLFPCAEEFLRALELGERQGVAVGETLTRQADLWRRRRLDKAEARALRVPVLLLAPLALCIFPNVLIALLGPFLLDLAWTSP